ncbi:hypothetical protein N8T08_004029 [Aspergillus melleus]|uniref:Uncharacterized protein n=1 Tax=Aspergillus melleus TaxID=138277 RepID=A0ACC3B6D4_9EURO|nr:hypothetical protein N8T08_004029 [Aspergillus melleus]
MMVSDCYKPAMVDLKARRTKILSLMRPAKPQVDIQLRQGPSIYTTGDSIQGSVYIAPDQGLLGRTQIKLQGKTVTKVEGDFARTRVEHTFLDLDQPAEMYGPSLTDDGRYRFPFLFIVPDQTLPQACAHPKTNCQVGDAHRMLPPTLGGPFPTRIRSWPADDLGSEMTRVSYCIKVHISKPSDDTSGDEACTKPLALFAQGATLE